MRSSSEGTESLEERVLGRRGNGDLRMWVAKEGPNLHGEESWSSSSKIYFNFSFFVH